MAWKYSILPVSLSLSLSLLLPRSRVEQCGQLMVLEQKYSEPSKAIGTWLPSRRKADRPPDCSSSASTAGNIGYSSAGAAGSSMSRMWLSLGILLIPNRPSQFDRPWPSCKWR